MSPDQYRKKWGLPYDYPMTCQTFHDKRSREVKARFGLKPPAIEPSAPPAPPAPPPVKAFVDPADAQQPEIAGPWAAATPPPPSQSEIAAKVRAEAEAIPARKVGLDEPPRATRKRHDKTPVVVEVVKRRAGQASAGAISSRKDAFAGAGKGNEAGKS